METKPKSKILIIVIGVLLLANIALVTFFILKPEPKKMDRYAEKKAAITSYLQKEVGFDATQLKQYDSLSNDHRTKTKTLMDSARVEKEQRMQQLAKDGFGDSSIDATANQAAVTQKAMEVAMLQHIKAIRQLCTPAQQTIFDSSFYKVFTRKGGDKKN